MHVDGSRPQRRQLPIKENRENANRGRREYVRWPKFPAVFLSSIFLSSFPFVLFVFVFFVAKLFPDVREEIKPQRTQRGRASLGRNQIPPLRGGLGALPPDPRHF
jgi:hypothetical protein